MMRTFVVETEELHACPHCGGRRLKPWRAGRDRLYGLSRQEFRYARCEDCALVFLSVRPRAEEAHKFYPEHYGPYQSERGPAAATGRGGGRVREVAGRSLKRIFDAINYRADRLLPDAGAATRERYYQPPKQGAALLDFGCGSDVFLNWAAARGWQTTGLDFSESVVRRVAESGHRALLMTPRAWDEIEDESLDFVRLSHVLEHLYEPEEVLRRLRGKMRPGALIHISVPNPASLSSRLFGARWFSLDCPRHVILYAPDVLRRLLERLGFAEPVFTHDVLSKDFVRSVGYVMQDRGWIGREEVADMAYRSTIEAALRLPARAVAALGLADRYQVFARKPRG